jgi:hypothetical protein
MICGGHCREIACEQDCLGARHKERVAYYPDVDQGWFLARQSIPLGCEMLGYVVRGNGSQAAWIRTATGYECGYIDGHVVSLPERG